MAQVYMFPEKKKLPKSIEDSIRKNAKEYMELLCAAVMLLSEDGVNQMDEDEIITLVAESYADGLSEAVDELK